MRGGREGRGGRRVGEEGEPQQIRRFRVWCFWGTQKNSPLSASGVLGGTAPALFNHFLSILAFQPTRAHPTTTPPPPHHHPTPPTSPARLPPTPGTQSQPNHTKAIPGLNSPLPRLVFRSQEISPYLYERELDPLVKLRQRPKTEQYSINNMWRVF